MGLISLSNQNLGDNYDLREHFCAQKWNVIPRTTCNPKQAWHNEAIAIEIKTLEVEQYAKYILARGNRYYPTKDKDGISNVPRL